MGPRVEEVQHVAEATATTSNVVRSKRNIGDGGVLSYKMGPTSPEGRVTEEVLQDWTDSTMISSREAPSLDDPPPDWIDKEKVKRGQAFAREYSGLVSLAFLLGSSQTFPSLSLFKVLLFTHKFESIKGCLRLLMDTRKYHQYWTSGDLWDPSTDAYKAMSRVQKMHYKVGRVTNNNMDKVNRSAPNTRLEPKILEQCILYPSIQKDWRELAQRGLSNEAEFNLPDDYIFMSQFDSMSVVLGNLAPMAAFPHKMGIHGVTRERIEDYAHMWRVFAYYLGLTDRFNPCSGTLEDITTRMWRYFHGINVPGYKNMTIENEYVLRIHVETLRNMSKALYWFVTTEAILLYMAWMLDIELPSCYNASGWYSKLLFRVYTFATTFLMRITWFRKFINRFLESTMQNLMHLGKN